MTIFLEGIFWLAVLWLVYVTVGYPLLMFLLATLRPKHLKITQGYRPRISFVMAAYNEERGIADRLQNYLDLDYPRELLTFYIGSDASTDATDSIIERFAAKDRSIILKRFDRSGKTQIVYELAGNVTDEIIVFTDADIRMEPDALLRIVECMSDPDVGGVIGRMVYHDPSVNAGNSGQKKYLELEDRMRQLESLFWTTVGPRGECFAVRRDSYLPMKDYRLSDDLNLVITIPMKGFRVWFEPRLVIHEVEKRSLGSEYRRRLRMGQQAAVTYLAYDSTRYPWRSLVGFEIWSHKFLRNLSAIPLALLVLTSISLAWQSDFFSLVAIGVLIWGVVMVIGYLNDRLSLGIRLLHYPLYFTSMLASLTIGSLRAVFSGGLEMWSSQRLE